MMGWITNSQGAFLGVIWALYFLSQGFLAESSCPYGFFPCQDKRCIAQSKLCDGVKNCKDGSDEADCDGMKCHEPDFFRCKNKNCVSSIFLCDGENECGDGSDEMDCETKVSAIATCSKEEFRCADNLCVPHHWACDGKEDCLDGSDETLGCSTKLTCLDGFSCSNNHCVPLEWHCDGNNDCGDNSDEVGCGHTTKIVPMKDCTVEKGLFACHDQVSCVELTDLCDGKDQCLDGSDEGPGCNSSLAVCPTYGCSSKHCISTPTGPLCICPSGFSLSAVKYCKDNDECQEYGICSQKCHNIPGSYECFCDKGYILQEDKKSCKAEGAEALLIFSTKTELRGYYLSSHVYYSAVKDQQHITGVAYDGLHLYWTSLYDGEEAIFRSKEDGSHIEEIVKSGLTLPEDVAIDWVTNNIYFTDAGEKHIAVCTTTGSACTVLIDKDVDFPRAIALLISEGVMFWTEWGAKPMIASAGMDGSSHAPFVSSKIHWPNGLALDQGNERLYWVDAKFSIIESIKFNGEDRRVILKGIAKHPYALAVFEDTIYWSDVKDSEILSCHKFTGKNNEKILYSRKNFIYGINIYHPSLHPEVANRCEKADCSDICLLAPNNSYSCACPSNKELNIDKHTCRDIEKKQIVVVAGGRVLIEVKHQVLGRQEISSLSPPMIYKIGALAYNSLTGIIIISDVIQKKLYTLSLKTLKVKEFVGSEIGTIEAMDFDHLGNNLYFCDTERLTVDILSLSTMEHKVLLRNLGGDVPKDIVTIPEEGVMFIALCNYDGSCHLDRWQMDGNGRTHVLEHILQGPSISLAYDSELRRVFWSDSGRRTIESTDVDGTDHHGYRGFSTSPLSVATLKKDLFWSTLESPQLHWANKYISNSKIKGLNLDMFDGVDKIILLPIRGVMLLPEHKCQQQNGGCSHICMLSLKKTVCACPEGMILENDNRTCARPVHCADNQYKCKEDNLCIPRSLRCNGRSDCPNGEDENECRRCYDDQFTCANGQCINANEHCDNRIQCSDGSDEFSCAAESCDKGTQFECRSGECINSHWRCNLIKECKDGSDEVDCDIRSCSANQFRCKSGACIPASWECDNEANCEDGSDEHNKCPPVTCSPIDFTCANGHCVDSRLTCNGMDDCGDYSDESCEKPEMLKVCLDNEFKCPSDGVCLPLSAKCNKTAECKKGEDERDCDFCNVQEFECANSKCIDSTWVCDNVDDCGDSSDEDHRLCVRTELPRVDCTSEQYQCPSGECIGMEHVCNNVEDCSDSSDEGGKCLLACSVGHPCMQFCQSTPAGPRCSCEVGYFLQGDGSTCLDINECSDDYLCSQICTNTAGSFMCDCVTGYALRLDKKSCKATGPSMEIIFDVGGNEIHKSSYSMRYESLVHRQAGLKVGGLDVDSRFKTVYWSTGIGGSIHSHSLINKKQSEVSNLVHAGKLALDWLTGNVYYTHDAHDKQAYIKVCNLDVRRCAKVVTAQLDTKVTSLAVDSISGYLFWSETSYIMFNNPYSTIHRAELSGASPVVIASTNLKEVTGIATDPIHRKVYWADRGQNRVEVADYFGDGHKIMFDYEVKNPIGMVFFEENLFWISAGSGQLTKCKLSGKPHRCERIQLHAYSTNHFTILQQERQGRGVNLCLMNNCSDLCVLGVNGPKCLCEDGTLTKMEVPCNKQNASVTIPQFKKTLPQQEAEAILVASGWSTATVVFVILLLGALTGAGYLIYKNKVQGNAPFDMKIHFKNAMSGFSRGEKVTSIPHVLKPGEHEYVNPMENAGRLHADTMEILEDKIDTTVGKRRLWPSPELNTIEHGDTDSETEYLDAPYSQKAQLLP